MSRRSAAELSHSRPGPDRARASGPAPAAEGGAEGASRGLWARGRRRKRRRRRRPRRPRRGSRSPSAFAEPREAETLSPGMQREEGFNTKMADGPDEYDTETGCVPLLHPEVRGRDERLVPGPGSRRPRSLRLAEGGGRRRPRGGPRGARGGRLEEGVQARARWRADNGGGDSGAGPAGAGSGTPSLAVPGGQRWRCGWVF